VRTDVYFKLAYVIKEYLHVAGGVAFLDASLSVRYWNTC
jgi:hypothetical protein